MKNTQKERLSEHLLNVDEEILANAYEIDDAKKLQQYIRRKKFQKKRPFFLTPGFGRVVAAAACLGLVLGLSVFASQRMGQGGGVPMTEEPNYRPGDRLPSWLEEMGTVKINSLDTLNYYTAMKVLSDPANQAKATTIGNTVCLTASVNTDRTTEIGKQVWSLLSSANNKIEYPPEQSDTEKREEGFGSEQPPEPTLNTGNPIIGENQVSDKIIYYELDPNEVFVVTTVIYFRIEVTNEGGFLASKVGTGIVDVVITENSLEPIITFKNGDRFYSCCENSGGKNGKGYSTHKYIEGFAIVKNLEQENYSFTVTYDNFNYDYLGSTAKSVECRPFKNGGSAPDGKMKVVSATYLSSEGGQYTIGELEEYFNTGAGFEDLKKPTTNLEFWIGDHVDDVDFSGYREKYGIFGGREYYGTGYMPVIGEEGMQDPSACVIYTITSYPDYSDKEQHITGIYISDPQVEVYGMTLESSFEEFAQVMEAEGYTMEPASEYSVTARKGKVWIIMTKEWIRIGIEVTNNEGIIF